MKEQYLNEISFTMLILISIVYVSPKMNFLFISAILVSGTFSPYNERKQDLSKNEPKLTSLHDTGQFFRYHEK